MTGEARIQETHRESSLGGGKLNLRSVFAGPSCIRIQAGARGAAAMFAPMRRVTALILLALAWVAPAMAQRAAPDWLRDGLIYEVFPRAFSPQGDFNGVT